MAEEQPAAVGSPQLLGQVPSPMWDGAHELPLHEAQKSERENQQPVWVTCPTRSPLGGRNNSDTGGNMQCLLIAAKTWPVHYPKMSGLDVG